LKKIDSYITTLIAPSISFFSRQEPVFGAPVQLFDLISGLSGTVIYFLNRYGTSHDADEAVKRILSCLVQLASERNGIPVWHTPKAFLSPNDTMTDIFPNGHLNCGLAHGIPGPLGAMAVARILGVEIAGLDEAIERLATWLLKNRHDDSWGMNWPMGIALSMEGESVTVGSRRPARLSGR
jgi:lantibiotic biosynthesis protein